MHHLTLTVQLSFGHSSKIKILNVDEAQSVFVALDVS